MTHPELDAHGSFAHLKLGRLAPTEPAKVRLADYLDASALPEPPAVCDWTSKVPSFPMYGNDKLGDCTIAAAGHMVQAWTANAGDPVTPDDKLVEQAYIPGTGKDDTGRVETDVLTYWKQTGIAGHRVAGYAAVNVHDQAEVKAAIWLFGGVYTGIALPITAQTQKVWDVTDDTSYRSDPGSWGGHAVPYEAYDAAGVTLVTWGSTLKATWAFHAKYTDEVYAVVSRDWLDAAGDAPSGLDLAQLTADLDAV